MDFSVERDYITLHSVNYAGRIPGTDYGYIRLSTFSSFFSSKIMLAFSIIDFCLSQIRERISVGLSFWSC